MKKHHNSLFKIGEIVDILGVTRKTILVYEEMGLLKPAVKDEKSGYRYYTADNMTQIRSIRSLQSLGLSLAEIKEYYYDTTNLDHHLERLMDLRAALAVMNDYVKKNHIRTTGPYRSIYLEGPPSRGTHTADYITQIVVPI